MKSKQNKNNDKIDDFLFNRFFKQHTKKLIYLANKNKKNNAAKFVAQMFLACKNQYETDRK